MSTWTRGKLNLRHQWDPGLFTFGLDVIPKFQPGQFVNLACDVAGERVRRSYSLASRPGAFAEFYLTRVAGGALSGRLAELPLGAEVEIDLRGQGFMSLDRVPRATTGWLIASGTGLGPFISMTRSGHLYEHFERVVLVHAVRAASQLGYRSELVAFARSHPGRMIYLPVISREPESGIGLGGRVPARITDGSLEARAGVVIDPDHCHFLLCGNPEMIRDTSAALAERGLRRHRERAPGHITSENYW